ncbi:Protein of unknown function [Lactobacillus helveticus CIRM-BIA 951]|uniref:Uncharacterized protein n=2 Tax=Lactobacillus helveticus TaxID=1587 RepID=U6FB18_LACHE|nr:Protein of unknown function [Lactobacillus helveticus CIRM-BIA 951]CDI61147.1 Protein of unknown function [Lactobacillus helveticus CIRM-BIA 104]CDI63107.1 Protein of unknown function [Lactobacillus helveticus CIRM-BIA 103]CDR74390.1 Protein of unknown function [Lactobacillus delbrueckii subsp. bulgaricus]
MGLDISVSDK